MTLEQAKVVGLFLGPWLCSYELRGSLNVKAVWASRVLSSSFEKKGISTLYLIFYLKLSIF